MKRALEKRIVFLGPVHPYRGGIASFSERLALEFQSQGWDVRCITFTYQYPKLFFPGKNQYSEESKPDLDIVRMIHSLNPFTWKKALSAITDFNPTIVVCPHWNPLMSWSSTWLLKRIEAKKLVLVHNLFPHEPRFYDNFLIKRLMRSSAKFLALSSSVYSDIKQHFPQLNPTQHSHPIYDHYGNLMSKQQAAAILEVPSHKDYLLFFGLVRAYKGLRLLLQAFSSIKDELPNLNLVIAGEFYEDQQIYNKIISDNQLQDRVIINNQFIADNQVAPYFNLADAVVLPYVHATQSGIGRIATYFVKPIIVTDVGSLAEQAKGGLTGVVTKPQAKDIALAIKECYAKSNTFAKNIQLEKESNTWRGLYNHIVNECV